MRLRIAMTALLLAPVAGCGGPQYVPVSGRVTLDGQPLANAVVTFLPVAAGGGIDAPGPGAMAVTDGQGQYTLRVTGDGRSGALVGEHRVRISTREAVIEEEGKATSPRERVPTRYNANTELKFTVTPDGSSSANFDLKSR